MSQASSKRSISMIGLIARDNPLAVLSVCGCLLLSGLLEAIGISSIFPIISIVLGVGSELPSSTLTNYIAYLSSFGVYTLSIFVVCIFVLKSIVLHIAYTIIGHNVALYSHKLRVSFIENILAARTHYIQSKSLGESLSVMTNDSIRAAAAYISAARALSGLIQTMIYVLYALWLSLEATILSVITMLFLAFLVKRTMNRTRVAGAKTTQFIHEISKKMSESLRGIKEAKATNKESYLGQQIIMDSQDLKDVHATNIIVGQTLRNIQDPLLMASALFCLIIFKDLLALDSGHIIFILAVYYRLMTSMNMLQGDYQKFLGQEDSLWTMKENIRLAQEQREIQNTAGLPAPQSVQNIRFESISFAYQDKQVFRELSLTFPAHKFSVLKGESGRGKTTCVDMICSLVQPDSGRIMIGDTPLSAINTASWRDRIGYVDQFPFLFKGTIRQNILLDMSAVSDAEVMNCLERCHLKQFIAELDGGLDFLLAEGGTNLSGGQRQRIAIARAIMHKPLYLILDEPTSALDQETAQAIFSMLKSLSGEMSVIAISHSTEIDSYADQILIL